MSHTARASYLELTSTERLFLRLWCLPPPPVPFEPRDALNPAAPRTVDPNPLARTSRVYGERFSAALRDRVFLDIGCGHGDQVLAAAESGASLAVGVDHLDLHVQMGTAAAQARGLSGRVEFTSNAVRTMGYAWADVALSQNSFEHFDDPAAILEQTYEALKPGGQFFVTFGPSWWHPFGVHHMFMIRWPWAHRLFSERTILRVRQLYRPNKPACWREVSLNLMTIAKLLRLIEASRFELTFFSVTPIRPLPAWLVRLKALREWTTSDVSVILTKPTHGEA